MRDSVLARQAGLFLQGAIFRLPDGAPSQPGREGQGLHVLSKNHPQRMAILFYWHDRLVSNYGGHAHPIASKNLQHQPRQQHTYMALVATLLCSTCKRRGHLEAGCRRSQLFPLGVQSINCLDKKSRVAARAEVDGLATVARIMCGVRKAALQQPQGKFSHVASMGVHLKSCLQEMKMNPPKSQSGTRDFSGDGDKQ